MKRKLSLAFFSLLLCIGGSFCFAYPYEVEIELRDGSIHHHDGYTNDGRIDNHFGYNPDDIVREDLSISPWPND